MRPLPLYLLLQRRRIRQQASRRGFSPRLRFAGWLTGVLAGLAVAVTLLMGSWLYTGLVTDLPPVSRLPTLLNPDDGLLLKPTRLYDRTGRRLLATLADAGAERRYLVIDPQKPDHFSPYVIQAEIGLAEPDFWQSSGVAWGHLSDPQPVTIAEEVADRLLLAGETADLRHALRMRLLAAQLVSRYGRAQVMEWHLNSAYYGRLAYGAESAARLYLGKSAADLNLAEAALLAAVRHTPALNPLDAPAVSLEHQQSALRTMLSSGMIDETQYAQAGQAKLVFRPVQAAPESTAPAFTNLVLEKLSRWYGRRRLELGGLEVITSLDADLQTQLTCTLQAQLARAEGRPRGDLSACPTASLLPALPSNYRPLPPALQGSAILLDLASGQVLAMAGDSTSLSESATSPGHSPGTLLTPFLAVSAFSRGFGPASLVWDIPGQLSASLDSAAHPAGKYTGPLSLRQALATDNLGPLQQLLSQIGAANAWQLAEPMGLNLLAQAADSSQLLFSGGSVRLINIAQAFSTLANLGILYGQSAAPGARLEPVTLLRVTDDQGRQVLPASASASQNVLSQSLAYLVQNVLSDEPARWPSLGYPNSLEIGRPAGAKMGVTTDGLNAWTAGFTPQRLVVTWIGAQAGAATYPAVDSRLASGLWHALIQSAVRDLPAVSWAAPAGVSKMDVCSPSGLLPTRACPNVVNEIFLNGNEPTGPDTLYRTFQVNRATGLQATVFTPPELVEDRTYLVLPEEARRWGQLAGLPVPPQGYDRIQPPEPLPDVHIDSPRQFAVVRGVVDITGSAAGSDFSYYQLQAGQGLNPEQWLLIGGRGNSPGKDISLGQWDTSKLNGLFVIRLQVVRQNQRLDSAILQVTVDNTPPRVKILSPAEGQILDGSLTTVGFQADASDAVGLERVEFWVDGQLVDTRTSRPYALPWSPRPGAHTLKVIAYDLAGNLSDSKVQFTIK